MLDFISPDIDWHNRCVAESASPECKEFHQCMEDSFLSQHVCWVGAHKKPSVLEPYIVFTREPDLVCHSEVIENLA